jgi:cellulose biosynthesis protein BcsQ
MAYLTPPVEAISPAHRLDEPVARRAPEWLTAGGIASIRRGRGRREREAQDDLTEVRREFGGLRQITVVNPSAGSGKTTAALLLALTFAETRGGSVLAWDDDEERGALARRAQPFPATRTALDLLRHVLATRRPITRMDELRTFISSPPGVSFDLLAAAGTGGRLLTAREFRQVREIIGRTYRLIVVDTGDDPQNEHWQAAVDATDQLVVPITASNQAAEAASGLLDQLEQTGRTQLAQRSVVVVTAATRRSSVDPRLLSRHFEQRCRAVEVVPFEPAFATAEQVSPEELRTATRRAWLSVAAAVATGL